jgi:hypothetical protein
MIPFLIAGTAHTDVILRTATITKNMDQLGGVGPGTFNMGNVSEPGGLSRKYCSGVTVVNWSVDYKTTHDSSTTGRDWLGSNRVWIGNVDCESGGTFEVTSMDVWSNTGDEEAFSLC